MRKLLIITTLALIFSSCRKEELFYVTREGVVQWGGDMASDGCGWYVVIGDKAYRPEIGFPKEFEQDNLKIKITFRVTFECKKNIDYAEFCCIDEIRIKSILYH